MRQNKYIKGTRTRCLAKINAATMPLYRHWHCQNHTQTHPHTHTLACKVSNRSTHLLDQTPGANAKPCGVLAWLLNLQSMLCSSISAFHSDSSARPTCASASPFSINTLQPTAYLFWQRWRQCSSQEFEHTCAGFNHLTGMADISSGSARTPIMAARWSGGGSFRARYVRIRSQVYFNWYLFFCNPPLLAPKRIV